VGFLSSELTAQRELRGESGIRLVEGEIYYYMSSTPYAEFARERVAAFKADGYEAYAVTSGSLTSDYHVYRTANRLRRT
jgi:hypothetical protein